MDKTSKQILYFGCIKDKGHYLFDSFGQVGNPGIYGINQALHYALDGAFVPDTHNTIMLSIVPPWMILSWIDNTVDSRPGSHSTFIFRGRCNVDFNVLNVNHRCAALLEEAAKAFPEVMDRQPHDFGLYSFIL